MPALVHSNLLTQSQQRLPHLLGGFCQLPIPFPCSTVGASSTSEGRLLGRHAKFGWSLRRAQPGMSSRGGPRLALPVTPAGHNHEAEHPCFM